MLKEKELVGIDGWLVVLAIRQVLSVIIDIIQSTPDVMSLIPFIQNSEASVYATLVLAAYLCGIGFEILVAVALFMKDRRFPVLFIVQWVLGCVAVLVLFIQHDESAMKYFIQNVVWGGIWVAYVVNSTRVKNTYKRRDKVDNVSAVFD